MTAENGGIPAASEIEYLDACTRSLTALRQPRSARMLAIERAAGVRRQPPAVWELNQGLARALLASNAAGIADLDVSEEIRSGFRKEFDRIGQEIERKPSAHFSFQNPRFRADLRILALRRIPAGMYDLEVGGIPRRLLGRQGLASGLRLASVVMEAGGFAPFFTQHLVPHRMKLFSPIEHERYLERVGQLLSRRPEIRGLLSTAWYNDPAVSNISPQLSYLREQFERVGRGIFVIGSSPSVVQDATAFSFERRKLVDAGKYVPKAYLGVILRKQLLKFSAASERS